jgi:hypothetical protein
MGEQYDAGLASLTTWAAAPLIDQEAAEKCYERVMLEMARGWLSSAP